MSHSEFELIRGRISRQFSPLYFCCIFYPCTIKNYCKYLHFFCKKTPKSFFNLQFLNQFILARLYSPQYLEVWAATHGDIILFQMKKCNHQTCIRKTSVYRFLKFNSSIIFDFFLKQRPKKVFEIENFMFLRRKVFDFVQIEK